MILVTHAFNVNVIKCTSKHTHFFKMGKMPNGSASFVQPFSNLNKGEFMHTVKDKKIKFTPAAKKQKSRKIKFLNKINTVTKNHEYGRTEHFDPNEINKPENSKKKLNFLGLSISFLPYPLSELQTS